MEPQGQKKKITPTRIFISVVVALSLVLCVGHMLYLAGAVEVSLAEETLQLFNADARHTQGDEVIFLSVGQGDCTVIKSGDATVVVDFGPENDEDRVYNGLLELGVDKIELGIITHHHKDHMGGFAKLSKSIKIDRLLMADTSAEDADHSTYKQVVAALKGGGTLRLLPRPGGRYRVGDMLVELLYFDPAAQKENNRSLIIRVTVGTKRVLFTGDAEAVVEKEITGIRDISCDILKMGHHGSYTSCTEAFLKKAGPKLAVASSGYDNLYNHPSKWAVQRLEQQGIRLYRTDIENTVKIKIENTSVSVTTERRAVK